MRLLATALLLVAWPAFAGTVGARTNTFAVSAEPTDIFVIWGDSGQGYVTNDPVPCLDGTTCKDLERQADWACAHKVDENIKAVLGTGDIVDNAAGVNQWANFMAAKAVLDGCDLVYSPAFGNHEALGDDVIQPNMADSGGDGTLYWTNVGIPLDSEPWFGGRGNYEEVSSRLAGAGPGETEPAGTNLYYEANNTGSRSFWIKLGSRFAIMAAEWEFGARLSDREGSYLICAEESNTWKWAQETMAANPDRIFIHMTHAGPCTSANCNDWTNTPDGTCGERTDWKRYRDAADNAFVFINGHNNTLVCANGGGQFELLTRDSGTPALAAQFDFTCLTRAYDATSYGWFGQVRWMRSQNKVCVRTFRGINATTAPATLVYPPDINRTDASNDPESCARVVLPAALR